MTFSELEERWIVRQPHINPKTSAVKLTLKFKSRFWKSVNPETVRNFLKKHKYYGRVPQRKPYISKANRKARLAFAKMYVKQSTEFWKNVIFVDESKYNIFGSDGQQKVWHTPNTALHIKNLRSTVKYGGANQLVWDCMASSGVGNLDFIDGTMNKYVYLDILTRNLKQSASNLGISRHFNSARIPKHIADICKLWVLYHCPGVIKTTAQSPDINPIEHVWDDLQQKINEHNISNKQELRKHLIEEWAKISESFCAKLIKSVSNKLREVIKCKGDPTRY
ncbi:Transposable element Tcb1 transposase [Araneus ventricosus]|uniref:Transposable element Tcb1 transposase n=1 Tax=Araneus ventricosus TaxID=182803 RepID=A0A4Y2BJ67_ARAVE|nr:Transposable element Tcb1 transposase [Araneus ventricosus]